MAALLPFDYASIDGDAVPQTLFVFGSGTISSTDQDITVTTADGRIHNIRQAVSKSATFQAYGNLRDTYLMTTPSLSVAIVLKRGGSGGTTVLSGNGVVDISYDKASETSTFNITMDPTTSGAHA